MKISQKLSLHNRQSFGAGMKPRPFQELWTNFHPDQSTGSRLMNFTNFCKYFGCSQCVLYRFLKSCSVCFILDITKVYWAKKKQLVPGLIHIKTESRNLGMLGSCSIILLHLYYRLLLLQVFCREIETG